MPPNCLTLNLVVGRNPFDITWTFYTWAHTSLDLTESHLVSPVLVYRMPAQSYSNAARLDCSFDTAIIAERIVVH